MCCVVSSHLTLGSPLRPGRRQFPRVMPLSKPGNVNRCRPHRRRHSHSTAVFCLCRPHCLCLCQWCHASLVLSALSNRGRYLTGPGEVAGADSLPDARGAERSAGGLTVRTRSVCRWPGRLLPTGRDGAGSADGPAHLYLFSY